MRALLCQHSERYWSEAMKRVKMILLLVFGFLPCAVFAQQGATCGNGGNAERNGRVYGIARYNIARYNS
jgi:hypothetical protein